MASLWEARMWVWWAAAARAAEPQFPSVTLENLQDEVRVVPAALPHARTVVILAFYQRQQAEAETWIAAVEPWVHTQDDLGIIEIPVVSGVWKALNLVVEAELKSAIRDADDRRRTYLYFGEPGTFLGPLRVVGTDQILVVLVTREGGVRWMGRGPATGTALKGLKDAVGQ
jgi:hypothetical protein